MKITEIKISVFEAASATSRFDMAESVRGASHRWVGEPRGGARGHLHLLHVMTDEGVEGLCTVGDARYTTMRVDDLEQLRILAVGENPLDRERLNSKLRAATRRMFTPPGWFGAFDNCLWDIAGKVAGESVSELIGRARPSAPAYFNCRGATREEAVEHSRAAVETGFQAVKDHFSGSGRENVEWFRVMREALGPDVDLMHDAAGCHYKFREALSVGRALEELGYRWFEEPLPDRDQIGLQQLCEALDVPVLAPESMMNDLDLSALWLISGATDLLRVNARHGTTSLLKLAHLAELHGTSVEMNGPGGLFGLVHAHLACAVSNTSYYEYFPGGTRDEVGREIGLLNPPVPHQGRIEPPDAPGWGAEWDFGKLAKRRVAEL